MCLGDKMKLYAMQFLAVVVISLCATSLAQTEEAMESRPRSRLMPATTVFDVDLRNGVNSSLPAGVTWHSPLTSNQEPCACDRQGVLKLTFSDPLRRRAEIKMTFENSQGWTFNVGDSVTNDGYAGDGGSQNNDAEVHSVDKSIYFYGRDNPAGDSYGLLHSRPNFVGVQPYTTVTLNVADELATADNGAQFLYINSYKLFALNDQNDTASLGVNRDVYLAMNRVVSNRPDRTGTGLCRVRVKFYSS